MQALHAAAATFGHHGHLLPLPLVAGWVLAEDFWMERRIYCKYI